MQLETERTTNPVIQRVKLIMSAGLMLVHMLSRWPVSDGVESDPNAAGADRLTSMQLLNLSKQGRPADVPSAVNDHTNMFEFYLRKWLSITPEQLVMLGLVTALTIKYIFYDSKENLEEEIRAQCPATATTVSNMTKSNGTATTEVQVRSRVSAQTNESPRIIVTSQDGTAAAHASTEPNVTSRRRSSTKKDPSASFFLGDDSASEFSEHEVEMVEQEVQTEESCMEEVLKELRSSDIKPRPLNELVKLLSSDGGVKQLSDDEVLLLVEKKKIPAYKLESVLGDPERGVKIRRLILTYEVEGGHAVQNIPYKRYDYSLVMGACCENVIGYMPIPLGIAGPLMLDGSKYQVPMATTEGCLVASTNRGCRALALSGGIRSSITGDGMTRGPVVRFPCASRAAEAINWLYEPANYACIKEAFDSTSRFARLEKILPRIAGRYLYIRFAAKTGDAMGMNMLSKGTELALHRLQELFTDMEIISLSGNFCSDKKPSAVNWIEGRGKSVVCEARVPSKVVHEVLKTTVKSLVDVNISKNLIGSAVAGSIGGFNAHAANIVAAVYIATGQDPAQSVGSSNCMTLIEPCGDNSDDLYITCTMPSMELGTIGGGTILPPQASCLDVSFL